MFAPPDCFQRDFEAIAVGFYQALSNYRIIAGDMADLAEDNPARHELEANRTRVEAMLQRAMRSMGEFVGQLNGVLDTLEQEAATVADQHGEDSPEYEALTQRREGYLEVAASVVAANEKAANDWETRDQP